MVLFVRLMAVGSGRLSRCTVVRCVRWAINPSTSKHPDLVSFFFSLPYCKDQIPFLDGRDGH